MLSSPVAAEFAASGPRAWHDALSLVAGQTRLSAAQAARNGFRDKPYNAYPTLSSGESRAAMTVLYFEDFAVGRKYPGSGRSVIDAAGIKSFAAAYDPEPFHLDEAAAARNPALRGLAASGWHTASITMRLLVESELRPAGGILGLGVDEIRWLRPVRPGDQLRVESEIIDVRSSESRPTHGIVKVHTTTFNQANEPVQILVSNILVARRST
jgi:acyl dehydratase